MITRRGDNNRDLARKNKGGTISKVIGGGLEGKTKIVMQRRVAGKRNRAKKELSEEKTVSCRVNCNVGLTDCTRLKDTLAATLQSSRHTPQTVRRNLRSNKPIETYITGLDR